MHVNITSTQKHIELVTAVCTNSMLAGCVSLSVNTPSPATLHMTLYKSMYAGIDTSRALVEMLLQN